VVPSSDSSFPRRWARGHGGVPFAAPAWTLAWEAVAACSAASGLPNGSASVPSWRRLTHARMLYEIHLASTLFFYKLVGRA